MSALIVQSGELLLKTFVSSRISPETDWARKACFDVLRRQSIFTPWLFERTPPSSANLSDSYLEPLKESDLVVWLVEATTSKAVAEEIKTALSTRRPILMFRIDPVDSDAGTNTLMERVGAKWAWAFDASDLAAKLEIALGDELMRAWRSRRLTNRAALLASLKRASLNRCIVRWESLGLSEALACQLAADPTIGVQTLPQEPGFRLLRGEIGVGKSLTVERFYQSAITQAQADANQGIPVFVEAKRLSGSLIDELNRQLGDSPDHETAFVFVIDGLDEASPENRIELAREARLLARSFSRAQVLLTSRPLIELGEEFDGVAIDIPSLTQEAAFELMARVAGRQIRDDQYWDYPESFHEAIQRPLFAILVAVNHREDEFHDLPTGKLIAQLVSKSLGRVRAREDSSEPLLRRLGRLTIENGGAPVPLGSVCSFADAAPLLRSRLVVEAEGRLSFPLAILGEWFAARDLEIGEPPIDLIVQDPQRLAKWLVPITICVSEAGESTVDRLMKAVAANRPALAAEILADAFNTWTRHPGAATCRVDWRDFGTRFRDSTEAWCKGLQPLTSLIAPVNASGKLQDLGILTDETGVIYTSWARRPMAEGVVELPLGFAQSLDWNGFHLRRQLEPSSGLVWRCTHDDLKGELSKLLRLRKFPLPDALRPEYVWRAGLAVVGREGSMSSRPIPRGEIEAVLAKLPQYGLYGGVSGTWDVGTMRAELNGFLNNSEAPSLSPPWTIPSEDRAGYVWGGYTLTELLARTFEIYTAGYRAYFEIADRWLPKFRLELELSTERPFRLKGVVKPQAENSENQFGPSICYYREHHKGGPDFVIDLAVVDEQGWDAFRSHANEISRTRRIGFTTSFLDIFHLDAAERLAYSKLERDLDAYGWH